MTPPAARLHSLASQAALCTPGDGRTIVAVACAEACQRMLGYCLGPVDPSAPAEEQQLSEAQVGAAFCMTEGGMTIVNWPQVSFDRWHAPRGAACGWVRGADGQQGLHQAGACGALWSCTRAQPAAWPTAIFCSTFADLPSCSPSWQGQDELGRGTVLCVNYQLPARP